MSLTDRRLELIARTDDEDLVGAVPSDVRNAVQGACEPNVRLDYVAPPEPDLRWRAQRDGDLVVLSGDVVSSAVKSSLVAQARRQFPSAQVRDEMRVVESKSKVWPRAAEAGLAALADVDVGEATLDRQALSVTGEMRYEPSTLERVRERLRRDVPRGYAAREQITMLRPQVPQTPAIATPPPVPVPQTTAPTLPTTTEARPSLTCPSAIFSDVASP